MAQRVVTELTDDLDGSAIADGSGETITFALDNVSYEIDLKVKNAAKLRKVLQPYMDAGRKVGGHSPQRRAAKTSRTDDPRSIRAWAVENGIELSARGRIPANIVKQYHGH
jgi:hypothetical protein